MKYQAYESYKDSGVTWESEVPSPWVETRFKWILTEKKKVSNFNLPAGSISFGNVVFKNEDSLAEDTKASYQELLQGEFLINPLNLNYDLKSLRTALSDKNVVVSTGYIILNSKEGFNKNYLRWVLQEFDVAHMKTLGAGVRQTITFADIGNSIFHYPNIDEQTHIAKFLDYETAKIDDLIAKQVRLIELLKEKRQAVISHAVTKGLDPNAPMKDSGVEWLGEIPKHWDIMSLKSCMTTKKGVAFKVNDFCESGIKVVKASDIKQKTIRESEIYLPTNFLQRYPKAVLQTGDLILSTVGSTPDVKNSAVGQIGKVPKELNGSLLNQNTVVFSSKNNLNQDFLFYLVQTDSYREHLDLNAHGTANQASLNISDMVAYYIAIPSLQEQIAIVKYLDRKNFEFSELENNCLNLIILLKERRTALISSAVTGKIDVRHWQPPTHP